MDQTSLTILLQKHLLLTAISYCLDLWKRYPFEFLVTRKRLSKAGDYCNRKGALPVITVNSDLHPYLFLTIFIHEFSHHAVHVMYGKHLRPHGREWKLAFRTLMEPVMNTEVFPQELLDRLAIHLQNPKASAFTDQKLSALFKKYQTSSAVDILVAELQEGAVFRIRKHWYTRGKLRRTKVECLEHRTNKKFLVPADFSVNEVQTQIL